MFGPPSINLFGGTRVVASEYAYETVPIFPDKPKTKRRMRRTIGRFGSLYRMNPLCYRTPQGLVMHPLLYKKLKDHTND